MMHYCLISTHEKAYHRWEKNPLRSTNREITGSYEIFEGGVNQRGSEIFCQIYQTNKFLMGTTIITCRHRNTRRQLLVIDLICKIIYALNHPFWTAILKDIYLKWSMLLMFQACFSINLLFFPFIAHFLSYHFSLGKLRIRINQIRRNGEKHQSNNVNIH
jgi:hypothetical protein